MSDSPEDLNYDFNYNLYLGRTLTQNLRSPQDKQRVFRWLRKLSQSNRNVQEMRLRNEFMYHLVTTLQSGEIHPPFKDPPPAGPLPSFAQMLPGGLDGSSAGFRGQVDQRSGMWAAGENQAQRPLLYKNSPDGGAFLAAQPIPKCGAFCYLAVIAKPK